MLIIVLVAVPACSVVPAPWVVFEGFSPRLKYGEIVRRVEINLTSQRGIEGFPISFLRGRRAIRLESSKKWEVSLSTSRDRQPRNIWSLCELEMGSSMVAPLC